MATAGMICGCYCRVKRSPAYNLPIPMNLATFTLVHILISLAGITTGFIVVGEWLGGKHPRAWTNWFLATSAATSITGFFFPFKGFTPPYAFGILSLLVLGVAGYALYSARLAGGWRKIHVISATVALYLNFFVLIAELFLRLPALKELAPTGTEPSFGITQGLVLVLFILLGQAAVRKFPAAALYRPTAPLQIQLEPDQTALARHGERFGAAEHVELPENAAQVRLHGRLADAEVRTDFLVAPAPG